MNKTKNRQYNNRLLLNRLAMLIDKYPDMRFTQLLANFEFIKFESNKDEVVALESADLIDRVDKRLVVLENNND